MHSKRKRQKNLSEKYFKRNERNMMTVANKLMPFATHKENLIEP